MRETCSFCAADFILDGVVDVLRDADGARFLDARACCEAAEAYGIEVAFDASYEELVEALTGCCTQRIEAGQAVRRGKVEELADVDGLLVEPIEIEIVTGAAQRLVFDAIQQHHRHHQRPTGWHFGVVARRGEVIVGVAVCGRPVSRHLQARGVVEVTRVCTWGDRRLRRDVASAIYRAAIAEYRRRRTVRMAGRELVVTEVVTYTLASESGASCRGAGFINQGQAGGGSWDRAARRRADAAPTEVKTRWSVTL